MSGGRQPRGRRDNGLDAAEFVSAGDLDPRVGEHLLDVLGLASIAAYLQPSADLHPITRTTVLPSRPVDRLFVDRARLAEARTIVERVVAGDGPDPTAPATPTASERDRPAAAVPSTDRELDVDAAWQQILTAYAGPDADIADRPARPARDTPDEGTADPPTGRRRTDLPSGLPLRKPDATNRGAVPVERRPAPDPGTDRAGTEDTDDLIDRLIDGPADALPADVLPATDDEGYDPPVPPPLPRASSQTVLAVLAIVAGLVIFFQPAVLGLSATFGLVLGITSILGGFGALVWRLRDGFADDDDGDDGARV